MSMPDITIVGIIIGNSSHLNCASKTLRWVVISYVPFMTEKAYAERAHCSKFWGKIDSKSIYLILKA